MSEDAFFALSAALALFCMIHALWGGYRRRWWVLLFAPIAFVAGFAGLMLAMAQFAQNDLPSDLAWLGFAPYFAAPVVPALLLAFGLGLLVSALRAWLRGRP